jgi:membrane protein DedA with SNARE-associated domain
VEFLPLDWLRHLIETYGLWIVFVLIMLESSGIPMPGETALVTAAIYAGTTHKLQIEHVVAVAAAGAIIGDNFGYLIGRWIGLPLLQKHGPKVGITADRLLVGRFLFHLHGGKIVFFGRFVAILRAFAAVLAGVDRMRWPYFLLMNALGGICWAAIFGFGAYWFGEQITSVAAPVGVALLIGAIALTIAGTLFMRRYEKQLIIAARVVLKEPESSGS